MKQTHKQALFGLGLAALTVGALTSAASLPVTPGSVGGYLQAAVMHRAAQTPKERAQMNVATRMQKRVEARFGKNIPLWNLMSALDKRQELLLQHLTVSFEVEQDSTLKEEQLWDASPSKHPEWISFLIDKSDVRFQIDKEKILLSFQQGLPLGLPPVVDVTLTSSSTDTFGIERMKTAGTAKAGYELDTKKSTLAVRQALLSNLEQLTLPMQYRNGTIETQKDGTVQKLHLLSAGRSDYRTSPLGRRENIQKAIDEKLNGVRIPQGQNFSFNSALGGPVTEGNGWSNSLIIVNGTDLEPAPGGGICQAATTLYRSALLAGLPITERAPHSLYVHYYELFGVGLDATIYPGRQDLNFVNDTPGDIVLQAFTHDSEVTIELYGLQDGRKVSLEGPYFTSTAPSMFKVHGRSMRNNEIAWSRETVSKQGAKTVDTIVSAYNKMPGSIALHYPEARGTEELLTRPDSSLAMQ